MMSLRTRAVIGGALVALAAAAAVAVCRGCLPPPAVRQLTFTEQDRGREIKPYYDASEDTYYLFLPAYTSAAHVVVAAPRGMTVAFSAAGYGASSTLAAMPCATPITLTLTVRHTSRCYPLVLLQSAHVAALFVDTDARALAAVRQSKDRKASATVTTIAADGSTTFAGRGTLTGRGNSTWAEAKKPFNLRFSQRVALAAASDSARTWCLLANYADASQLRNATCHYIARRVGVPYTSALYAVELYINGEYQGLYNLALRQPWDAAPAGTLAAVFEGTRASRQHDGSSAAGFCFRARYGSADSLRTCLDAFETALYAPSTPYAALADYADLSGFAAKMFVDIVCGDSDLALSQYYMLTGDGLLAPLCAWDYDNTFGLTFFYVNFAYNMLDVTNDWYDALFRYASFRQALLALLTDEYASLAAEVDGYLDAMCDTLACAWEANHRRWRHEQPCWDGRGALLTTAYALHTLQGQKEYISAFLARRIAFLEDYWRAPEDYCRLTFHVNGSEYREAPKVVLIPRGDTLRAALLADGLLSMPEEGFAGWYTAAGAALPLGAPLMDDMDLYEAYTPRPLVARLWRKVLRKAPLLIVVAGAALLFVGASVVAAVRRRQARARASR